MSTHNAYHSDANGNVTALMNSAGVLQASYKYNPYGGLISSSGPLAGANTMRFSSKPAILSATGAWGFYYYGYRFYDPGMQRWLNRDPMGERGGLNLSLFNGSSSLNTIDPDGRRFLKPFAKWCWKQAAGPGTLCVDDNCQGKDLSAFTYLAEDELKNSSGSEQDKRLRKVPNPGDCVKADAVYMPGIAYKVLDGGGAIIDCGENGVPRIQDAGTPPIRLVSWKQGDAPPDNWPDSRIKPYKDRPPGTPEPTLNPFPRPHGMDVH